MNRGLIRSVVIRPRATDNSASTVDRVRFGETEIATTNGGLLFVEVWGRAPGPAQGRGGTMA